MTDNKGRRDIIDATDVVKKPSGSNTDNKDNISEKIRTDIEKLDKNGYPSPADVIRLYNKYGDNDMILEEILRQREKKYKKMKRKARKMAEKIYKKYNEGNRPLHEILESMMKYKTKYKWSTSEYDEFRKELMYLLSGNRAYEVDYNQNLAAYRSRINKALGNPQMAFEARFYESGLKIKDSEHSILNEILALFQQYSSLHKTVFMHSLMYEDCSLVALTGEFKRERHIASNFIHPLLACMFLPKFDIFEIHMLYSNFGSIIKARYEKKPIMTEPDYLLFYDITSDPNDVVCEINSPIADIRNRFKVQISLWETILKLRNGNYYEASPLGDFTTALNACRNNIYDNADLAYNQDEGTMLRRILSVFSLRPTFIYTKPIFALSAYNAGSFGFGNSNPLIPGLGQGALSGNAFGTDFNQTYGPNFSQNLINNLPFNNQPVHTVTSIPMITLQIPPFVEGAEPKDIKSARTQTVWINENKTLVPKEQSIIYSKEVLIFYVNRRIQRIQIKTFSNPLTFSQLPLTMSSFERLNPYPIVIPDRLTLGRSEETYNLRSVVAVTQTEIKQGDKITNLITGQTGLLMTHMNFEKSIYDQGYYLYDPFGASLPVRTPENAEVQGYFTNKPISRIQPYYSFPTMDNTYPNQPFFERASTTGTIFIYANPSGYNPSETISV